MSLFPSLPDTPHLRDVFRAFPQQVIPLLAYHDALLRAESPMTVAERELIAAYVSGLNACDFCYGAHRIYANTFGIDNDTIDGMMSDLDASGVEAKMKPILRYVRKLNTLPARLTSADAQAVFDAGWSERALYDAVQICGLFNLMNRIIEGTGVTFDYAKTPPSDEQRQQMKTASYTDFGKIIGITNDAHQAG